MTKPRMGHAIGVPDRCAASTLTTVKCNSRFLDHERVRLGWPFIYPHPLV